MNKMREYPVGSGKFFPTYDAERPLELSLVEQDRCSGIRHDCRRCAVSTTLKTKLGAMEVETGKDTLYVLWRIEHGPHRGEIAWERWQIPAATKRGIARFDVFGEPVPPSLVFTPSKPTERLDGGKRMKQAEARKHWASSQPGYVTKNPQGSHRLVPSRSLSGKVHLRVDVRMEER